MLNKLNSYPKPFRDRIESFIKSPCESRLLRKDRDLALIYNDPPKNSVTVSAAQLPAEVPMAINTTLIPCLFIAAVARHSSEEIEKVRAGHFRYTVPAEDITSFLKAMEVSPERICLWMAGLGQMGVKEMLQESVNKIVQGVTDFGIPINLNWISDDVPVLSDSRTGNIISDLGIGVFGEGDLNARSTWGISRDASLLATCSRVMMISTLYINAIKASITDGAKKPSWSSFFEMKKQRWVELH